MKIRCEKTKSSHGRNLKATRLIESLLFGVRPTDAVMIAAVVAIIIAVAAIACGLPAWRASRLDPIVGLRAD